MAAVNYEETKIPDEKHLEDFILGLQAEQWQDLISKGMTTQIVHLCNVHDMLYIPSNWITLEHSTKGPLVWGIRKTVPVSSEMSQTRFVGSVCIV